MTKKSFAINDFNRVFKKEIGRDLSDAEILEIEQSLYYFAKAKIAYLKQKEGDPHAK